MKITKGSLPQGSCLRLWSSLTYRALHNPDLYSFYTSYNLYVVACGPSGRPPWKAQVPQCIRHSRHRHKNLHNDHRCGRAFDAGCNLQKHYGCYSREGMRQEFLSAVPRVCWWGFKSGLTLIKHEDEMISWFSGVSFRLWSEESLLCEGIKGVKHNGNALLWQIRV